MKNTTPKLHKKRNRILSIIVSILLLIGLGLLYVYGMGGNIMGWVSNTSKNSINLQPSTSQEKATGAAIKSSAANSSTEKSTGTSDTPPAPVPITGSTKKSVQVYITASGQNNDIYQVRSLIGALMDNGTCTLVLTQGSKTVTKIATTQALANSSTCRGFDIQVSELSAGQWQLVLSVSSPTLTGSTTSTISVQ